MIDEIAALGWLRCRWHCALHGDRRVRDFGRAMESTKPDGGYWVMVHSFGWNARLADGSTEGYSMSRFFYLDDIRKN